MADHETRNDDASAPTEWNTIIIERPISYADAVEFAEKIIEFLQKDFDPASTTKCVGNVTTSELDGAESLMPLKRAPEEWSID